MDSAFVLTLLDAAREEVLVLYPKPDSQWQQLARCIRAGVLRTSRFVVRDCERHPLTTADLRVHADLRTFLMIVDRHVAIVADDAARQQFVADDGRLARLLSVFDQHWQSARQPVLGATDADLHVRILARLAAGATDASVAKELSISRRTVLRHVNEAMKQCGATSRFELGLQLARANSDSQQILPPRPVG